MFFLVYVQEIDLVSSSRLMVAKIVYTLYICVYLVHHKVEGTDPVVDL